MKPRKWRQDEMLYVVTDRRSLRRRSFLPSVVRQTKKRAKVIRSFITEFAARSERRYGRAKAMFVNLGSNPCGIAPAGFQTPWRKLRIHHPHPGADYFYRRLLASDDGVRKWQCIRAMPNKRQRVPG